MKLILQAIKSLLNKLHIRLESLEDKTSDENIAGGKFLPDGTPYLETFPVSFHEEGVYNSALGMWTFPGKMKLTTGLYYTVTVNGDKYECKCKEEDNGKFLEGLSDFSLAIFDVPFLGSYIALNFYQTEPDSVTLSVEGVSKVPHKMDAMLIPDGYVTPLVVTCGEDDIPDHTHDEAVEAVEAGRDVVIFRISEYGTISVYKLSGNRYGELYFYSNYLGDTSSSALYVREARWESGGLVFTEKQFQLTT